MKLCFGSGIFEATAVLLCLVCQGSLAQQPAKTTPAPRVARPPTLSSPEVHPDRRVTFRLRGPQVREVRLVASWFEGPKQMSRNEEGIWSLTIGPIEAEIYNYLYSIDGVRIIDPHNPMVKTGIRSTSSVLSVPAAEPAFYDVRNVPHGAVHIRYYYSRALNLTRRMHVYTPPGYDPRKGKKYPVLYLLHGAGDDDYGWMSIGRANLILDNLLAEKEAEPMIVVMPFGHTPLAGGEAPDRALRNERFSNDLLGDVIPFIETNYRVKRDADSRAIAGLSMGGGQAGRVGLGHLGMFHWVGMFSAALRDAESDESVRPFLSDPDAANKTLKLLWIGCGKNDFLLEANKQFVALLAGKGIEHTYRLTEGDHSWPIWRNYLHEMAPLLFK